MSELSVCYILTCLFFMALASYVAVYLSNEFLLRFDESPLSLVWPSVKYILSIPFVVVFVLSFYGLPFQNMMFIIIFLTFLLIFVFLDIASYCLPALFTVPFWFIGYLYHVKFMPKTSSETIFASFLIFFVMCLLRFFLNKKHNKEVFGLGDIYLMSALSMWVSVPMVFFVIGASTILGGGVHLVSKKKVIPFAPFLSLTAVVALPFVAL